MQRTYFVTLGTLKTHTLFCPFSETEEVFEIPEFGGTICKGFVSLSCLTSHITAFFNGTN
jgi:hypothetical protein